MGEIALRADPDELAIQKVEVTEFLITAHISDGRIISLPIAWFERLRKASIDQLSNFEISPSGYGVHWPDVDEDLSVKTFLGL
jgi:hypothetical protein